MQIPELTTARLRLEPLGTAHSAGMFALWSAPEVCAHAGRVHDLEGNELPLPARTPAASDAIVRFFEHHLAAGTACRWALVRPADGRFVGTVGFNQLGATCELAYHLLPAFWGQGLMTEAARAAVAWARERWPGAETRAYVEPQNRASVALARRLGFERGAEVRDGAERWRLAPGAPLRGESRRG